METELISRFHLTSEEQNELLPSGKQTKLRNRIHWASWYLKKALLLDSAGKGLTRITQRGKEYYPTSPNPIKPVDLLVFPEFAAFQKLTKSAKNRISATPVAPISTDKATPEEIINAAFEELRDALAQEVLDRIKSMLPALFEQLIVDLMLKLGYGGAIEDAGKTLGKPGDGGVDGVISQDKLGLDKIYLQAKRWNDTPVGSKEVQAFVGALVGQGVTKGVFITTSKFTDAALKYVDKNPGFKISLIDGYELSRLMIDHDLGVSLVQRYDLKRIDSEFFSQD